MFKYIYVYLHLAGNVGIFYRKLHFNVNIRNFTKYRPEHISHQCHGFFRGCGYDGGQRRGCELGELEVHAGGQLVTLRPLPGVRCAQHGADLEYLVYLRVTRKQRSETTSVVRNLSIEGTDLKFIPPDTSISLMENMRQSAIFQFG